MVKNYFYIILLITFFFSVHVTAQDTKQLSKVQETPVEGLSLYPNPVNTGKVYIVSKNELEKEIVIFDVLGKKVLQTIIDSKELNVSNLSPGVYIIKVTEQNATSSRKLIIR